MRAAFNYFFHMSAAVVTLKSKIPFLIKFKIVTLKIGTFSILMIFLKCYTKESMNWFFCFLQSIPQISHNQEFVKTV